MLVSWADRQAERQTENRMLNSVNYSNYLSSISLFLSLPLHDARGTPDLCSPPCFDQPSGSVTCHLSIPSLCSAVCFTFGRVVVGAHAEHSGESPPLEPLLLLR